MGCGISFHPECWRRLSLSQGLDSSPPYYCGRHHPNGLRVSIARVKDANTREITQVWKVLAKTKTELEVPIKEKRRGGKMKVEEEQPVMKKRRLVKRKTDMNVVLVLSQVARQEGLWEQRKPMETDTEAEWEKYLSM
jgi:hypothetical protein